MNNEFYVAPVKPVIGEGREDRHLRHRLARRRHVRPRHAGRPGRVPRCCPSQGARDDPRDHPQPSRLLEDRGREEHARRLRRSFDLGFGTETDVRDRGGELVISHDPPHRRRDHAWRRCSTSWTAATAAGDQRQGRRPGRGHCDDADARRPRRRLVHLRHVGARHGRAARLRPSGVLRAPSEYERPAGVATGAPGSGSMPSPVAWYDARTSPALRSTASVYASSRRSCTGATRTAWGRLRDHRDWRFRAATDAVHRPAGGGEGSLRGKR